MDAVEKEMSPTKIVSGGLKFGLEGQLSPCAREGYARHFRNATFRFFKIKYVIPNEISV